MKLSIRTYVWLGILLGVIGILNAALITQNSLNAGRYVSYLLDVAVLVLTFMVGRHAKQQGKSAVWSGALVGALFGAISAFGSFFVQIRVDQITAKLAKTNPNLDPNTIAMAVEAANSLFAHIIGVISAFVIFGVIGLILGVIGGSTTKRIEG